MIDPSVAPEPNTVKVRIWRMNLSERRVGHVSLQTAISYVSLWPYGMSKSVEFDNQDWCLFAPAVGCLSYDAELEAEGGVAPDIVYEIPADTKALDNYYLEVVNHPVNRIDKGCVHLNLVTWFVLAQNPTSRSKLIDEFQKGWKADTRQFKLNCALAVFHALELCDLPVKEFWQSRRLYAAFAEAGLGLLAVTTRQNFGVKPGTIEAFQALATPAAVEEFLRDHIKGKNRNAFEQVARRKFELGKIKDIMNYYDSKIAETLEFRIYLENEFTQLSEPNFLKSVEENRNCSIC